MPMFLLVGATWLNVEGINTVATESDNQGNLVYCRIWFNGGGTRDFHGADARKVVDFIRAHRAE